MHASPQLGLGQLAPVIGDLAAGRIFSILTMDLRMQENFKRAVMQSDPDYGETILGSLKLVCGAFERGRISWERRCELLELLAKGGVSLFETREYEKPHSDPDVTSIGVFLEPTASFLRELGLSEAGSTSLEQVTPDIDVKR
jgi:hypothetical protein